MFPFQERTPKHLKGVMDVIESRQTRSKTQREPSPELAEIEDHFSYEAEEEEEEAKEPPSKKARTPKLVVKLKKASPSTFKKPLPKTPKKSPKARKTPTRKTSPKKSGEALKELKRQRRIENAATSCPFKVDFKGFEKDRWLKNAKALEETEPICTDLPIDTFSNTEKDFVTCRDMTKRALANLRRMATDVSFTHKLPQL